jgi:pilus assembly protein Flp/PilA
MRLINEGLLRLMAWVEDQKGQTMAEYGLILALVAVVVITAVALLGTKVTSVFNDLAGHLTEVV